MIVVLINNVTSAFAVLQSAYVLSQSLKKRFGVILSQDNAKTIEVEPQTELQHLLSGMNICADHTSVRINAFDELDDMCHSLEVSFLYIQLTNTSFSNVKSNLKACRELRIPYLFHKEGFPVIHMEKVLIPVNFLIEEIEKAQFGAAFGRFCGSSVTLLQANDYGSKAATNVEKIRSVFDKFDFDYQVLMGEKDSFKIEFDALVWAEMNKCGIVIASASREYGLDDVVFGPKELHLIRKTKVPLMLINPRGDLYTLCD
ncbi:MAG: hypothetical protein VB102_00215 [Paludibacter sp.]|nr:hypothetical protein [Paludibacter sp.]